MNPNQTPDADAFMRARLAGCRKGGARSGRTRRENGKRINVEIAIRNRRLAGTWTRDTAGAIARYLGVSARYVRLVAAQIETHK